MTMLASGAEHTLRERYPERTWYGVYDVFGPWRWIGFEPESRTWAWIAVYDLAFGVPHALTPSPLVARLPAPEQAVPLGREMAWRHALAFMSLRRPR